MNMSQINYFISVLLTLSAGQAMSQTDLEKRLTNTVSQKISSGDVQGLVQMMPALEPLWKEDPEAYLRAVRQAVPPLRIAPNPDARKAALDIFASVVAKTSPSETVAATTYFQLKSEIIRDLCGLEEVRSDKTRLLMIASFVGEIRARKIPGYQNQGTNQPGRRILVDAHVREAAELPNGPLRDAYDKAVKQNEEDMKMNQLQLELLSANEGLTFSLMAYSRPISAKKTENREYYQQLAARAQLTAEERTRIQSGTQ